MRGESGWKLANLQNYPAARPPAQAFPPLRNWSKGLK